MLNLSNIHIREYNDELFKEESALSLRFMERFSLC